MTHIKLMGELGKKFGTEWNSGSTSVRDALKLIDCQVEGFKEYIIECHQKNIQFSIQNGEDFIEEFEELTLKGILKNTLIITPVPAGSGKGLGKLIAAALLIAAFLFIPGAGGFMIQGTGSAVGGVVATGAGGTSLLVGGTAAGATAGFTGMSAAQAIAAGASLSTTGLAIAMIGVNLAMMGLAEMSAPDAGSMESDPAFLFNGADNNIEQGQPVPLLYGTLKIGGTAISQGFKTGQLKGMYNTTANSSSSGYTHYGDSTNGTTAAVSTQTGNNPVNDIVVRVGGRHP